MTARQKIVVDAYNVIYADDDLRRVAIKDLERARRRLVSRLVSYVREKELQVTLVFDGKGTMTDAETVLPGKIQAVYTPRHQTADDLIISMIAASENPKEIIVVTSDRAHIRPAAAQAGCPVVGSREFLGRIQAKKVKAPEGVDDEKPTPESGDTDYWLDRFGGDS
jgi:predicted RNA-binding protein with PIN domain